MKKYLYIFLLNVIFLSGDILKEDKLKNLTKIQIDVTQNCGTE